jgi:hypothetical protein
MCGQLQELAVVCSGRNFGLAVVDRAWRRSAVGRLPAAMNARYRARRLPWEAPELVVARAPPDGGGGWLGA